ncbi:MAG: restriction endonuclease subunit S [Methylobacter sp.]
MLSKLERTLRIDTEFYTKENLLIEDFIKKSQYSKLTDLVKVSDGNHMSISEKFIDSGIPYYRGQDIHSFFIEGANPNCIDHNTFNLPVMKRSHLKKGDVLLSIVGTIGKLGLVTTNNEATCSCKLAILRPSKIIAEFLSVFLASKYGQNQIKKFTRGAVQMGLILEDFDQLFIPFFDDTFQSQIETLVKNAQSKLEKSKSVCTEAETLLLDTLGMVDFSPSTEGINIKSFKDSFAATGRLDAEAYQPKYDQLRDILENYSRGMTTIDELAGQITNGAEVREYQEKGVAYLRVGDLKNLTIDASSVVRIDPISAEKGLEKIDLQIGDVLVSRSGSLAVTAVVEPEWKDALISSHLIRLRITDARIDPYYLALFLCAVPGKMQIQQRSNGGVQPEISQPALKSIVVPILPQSVQQEIRRLILSARKLRDLSNDLLFVAKRAVEIAIEQDENAGMAYIKANS